MSQTVSLPIADEFDPFAQRLAADGQSLERVSLSTLQINLGKMCNLACHHCHVEAGPGRSEIMPPEVMDCILGWIDRYRDQIDLHTVDLTGGAPEMNPNFRYLVEQLTERELHVLDRCNLTIVLEDGYTDLPAFMAEHRVQIVASLPCYLEDNVDAQRGKGVYHDSIEALKQLNEVGYGMPGTGLMLNLVYNPVGYGLPPDQPSLEADYKRELAQRFDIYFNELFTIANMPIKRFEHALQRDGKMASYMDKLIGAHHRANVNAVMCRNLVSIGWQGTVYDCDFNQMLAMSLDGAKGLTDEHAVEAHGCKLWEMSPAQLVGRRIQTGRHCFGCTAGAGSSCTGSLS